MVGAADPFQLFRIMHEIVQAGALAPDSGVNFMLDQCHNIEPKIPAQIRSVMNVQEATAKALLVDAGTGEVLAQRRAPHPDGTEVDPRAWLTALDDAAGPFLEEAAAVSVGGQQHGMVALDEHDAVVRDALLWNDTRSAPQARQAYTPTVFVSVYSPVKGRSVPAWRRTWYSAGLSCSRHSASDLTTFAAESVTGSMLPRLCPRPANAPRMRANAFLTPVVTARP